VLVVALLPLHADAGLLAFSGLVALSYAGLGASRVTGVWELPAWVPWVEYGGWALVTLAALLMARSGRYRRIAACPTESMPT